MHIQMPSFESKKKFQAQVSDAVHSGDNSDSSDLAEPLKLPYKNSFEHTFENFHLIKQENSVYSKIYRFGPFSWRLILFPQGNTEEQDLSLYLDVADADELLPGWRREVTFKFTLVNVDESRNMTFSGTHIFRIEERDRGFANIMGHKYPIYMKESEGYLVNDALTFRITFEVEKIWDAGTFDGHSSFLNTIDYNAKIETGFVGLRNQGATCYLNSFLQSLFHLPYFRSAVYAIPTDSTNPTIPYALQLLFWDLETSNKPVFTTELTKSFGWKSEQLLMQHDIQELARLLEESLEDRMKGTPVEGTIEKLFRGQMQSCVRCTDIDFWSLKDEVFYDLSLNIHKCLYESIDKFTEVEKLEGPNRWKPNDTLGLQTANKWIKFKTLPPILHLHLKRFNFDWNLQAYVKDNSKLVFPPELDLSPYMVSENPNQSETLYALYGVLVHSGGMDGGHYYAFLRPYIKSQWYCFDDSLVKGVDESEAIDDNFGGNQIQYIRWQDGRSAPVASEKFRSAYMLIYVRKSDQSWIFDSNKKFHSTFLENMKMKSRLDVENDTWFRVFTGSEFAEHFGIGLAYINRQGKRTKLKKGVPLSQLINKIEKNISLQKVHRLWKVQLCEDKRHVILKEPFSSSELSQSMEVLQGSDSTFPADVLVYAESAVMEFEKQMTISEEFCDMEMNKSSVLVFFKIYNPKNQRLDYIKRVYMKSASKSDVLTKATQITMNAFSYFCGSIIVWQETATGLERVSKQDLSPVKNGSLFLIEQDDYQRLSAVSSPICRLYSLTEATFKSKEDPLSDPIVLCFQKYVSYKDLVKKLCATLGCKEDELSVYPADCHSGALQPSHTKIDMQNKVFFYKLSNSSEGNDEVEVSFFWRPDRQIVPLGPYSVRLRPDADVGTLLEAVEGGAAIGNFSTNAEICLLAKTRNELCVCPRDMPVSSIGSSVELVVAPSLKQAPNTKIVTIQFVKNVPPETNVGLPIFFELFEKEDVSSIIKRASETYILPDDYELSSIALFSSASSTLGQSDELDVHRLDKSSFPLLFCLTSKSDSKSDANLNV
ncbi:uncharacterized protein LOC126323767 [Schistocerca gregaria]|uniref:uncharacterized protein LOC126323767 n=1 Tax=Schistocerca gregaria TaxID=7010 RepID=UPI00211EA004|nr:uncharacterized protein LOC126323767 [Schistocerca gregaria]XP_049850723.1 uncharacterized protein LOC126323767 [Schistocerca gregaria]